MVKRRVVLLVRNHGLMVYLTQKVSLKLYDIVSRYLQDICETVRQSLYWLVIIDLVRNYSANAQNPAHILRGELGFGKWQKLKHQTDWQIYKKRFRLLVYFLYHFQGELLLADIDRRQSRKTLIRKQHTSPVLLVKIVKSPVNHDWYLFARFCLVAHFQIETLFVESDVLDFFQGNLLHAVFRLFFL